MPQFEPGLYDIFPKSSNPPGALGIGPVPYIWPPADVAVGVFGPPPIDSWTIDSTPENNTFVVFALYGKGPPRPSDYKWIVTDKNDLFVSSVKQPNHFRFESAGNGLWKIGLFGKDAVLTYEAKPHPHPQLTFKPADGSDAQLFKTVPVLKD